MDADRVIVKSFDGAIMLLTAHTLDVIGSVDYPAGGGRTATNVPGEPWYLTKVFREVHRSSH